MIDLHSHILPGVDDGARTVEEARQLARAALAEGITAIAATPHVREDFPTTAAEMERAVAELRRDFEREGIGLQVLHGGELDVTRLSELPEDELERFTIAQGRRYLLVEFPYYGWPLALEPALFNLRRARITPIIGHPERNADVQDRPERLAPFVEAGALVQVTAASVDGRLGRASRRAAEQLLTLGLVHLLASDAHGAHIRDVGLAAAAQALGRPELARYLTVEVPGAIVSGAPVPAAPRQRRRRFLVL